MGAIAEVDMPEPLQQSAQFAVGFLQILVVADDGAVLGHQIAQFAPQFEWVLCAVRFHQRGVVFFLTFAFGVEVTIARVPP